MAGRVKRKLAAAAVPAAAAPAEMPPPCPLCGRPLGRRVEWHHPVPKAEGGRATVAVHPICHRAIHAALDNAALARRGADVAALRDEPALTRFARWVAGKPPDFDAPTRATRERRAATRER